MRNPFVTVEDYFEEGQLIKRTVNGVPAKKIPFPEVDFYVRHETMMFEEAKKRWGDHPFFKELINKGNEGLSKCCKADVVNYPKEVENPKGIFLPVWKDFCKKCGKEVKKYE